MSCIGGQCHGGTRCAMHASLWAKEAMELRGWVCVTEYGAEASRMVDLEFIKTLEAIKMAGVDMQRWMAGWDQKRGEPIYGVWAPKPVAAILGCMAGRGDAKALAEALQHAKVSRDFAAAIDAAWRMGGTESALEIIRAELPHLADKINQTVRSA